MIVTRYALRPTRIATLLLNRVGIPSSEGNLVNALDNANPSGLLLHAIRTHPAVSPRVGQEISPELRLHMATLKQKNGTHEV